MHKSSVASIREQIALEAQAARFALSGYNATAQHSIIDSKYKQIGMHLEELKRELGEQQALALVVDILNQEE